MTRPAVRLAASAVVTGLFLAGCASDDTDAADSPPEGPSATTSAAAPETVPGASAQTPETESTPVEVPEVLQFEATTVGGDAFDGASVAGKPVVLWFWAPWCSVCASQVPEVTDLAETYGDDIAFVGVGGLDPDEGAIEDFAENLPGLTNLSDTDGKLYQRFGIAEQSSFVVLGADGEEVLRTGYSDDDQLAGAVEELAG